MTMDEMKNLEELAEENRRLKEENERLQNLSPKERLYEHIHVSVRTMNIIIGCLCALFVLVMMK